MMTLMWDTAAVRPHRHSHRPRPADHAGACGRTPRVVLCVVALCLPTASAMYVAASGLPLRGHLAVAQRRRCSNQPMAMQSRELTKLADDAEYQSKVDEAKRENKVIVIKFHASWCRACKAMADQHN